MSRWLDNSSAFDPFASLPFGYGQRVCIGRTVAETSLLIFTLRVFSEFRVRWRGGDMDVVTVPINKPSVPLLFSFEPRAAS